MKIVYLDYDDQNRHLHTIYLENILEDVEVLEFFSVKSVIVWLNNEPTRDMKDVAMILANSNCPDLPLGELYAHVRMNHPEIPFVLFSEELPEMINGLEGFESHNHLNSHMLIPISPVDFRECVLSTVHPNTHNLTKVAAFQKVRLINFYRFNKVLCNVYLKLSERKYIKVLAENEIYTKQDLEKFKDKKVDYLYIRNDDFQKFRAGFKKNSFLSMDTTAMSPDEIRETLSFSHAMMQDLAVSLGISKEVTELAEKSVNEIIKMADEQPSLSEIFNKFRMRQDYLYDHSFLTSIICCEILKNMKMSNKDRVNTLCMASLFHDITLSNEKLAKIQDADDPELQKFDENDIKKFMKHPIEAANLIWSMSEIPPDVSTVILQHHENEEGTGFPNKLQANKLDKLTLIFKVAHEIVHILFTEDEEDNFSGIMEKVKRKFNLETYKPILSSLEEDEKLAS